MATTKSVRLQAHFQHRWDHCGQQHEWRNERRQVDHAALSTLHAVCSCIIWRVHNHIPHGSSRSHLFSMVIPSMDMRIVVWAFLFLLVLSFLLYLFFLLFLMTDGDSVTMNTLDNFFPNTVQEHSGRNLIDLSWKDNVIIQRKFFQCKNHVGCLINLHSIISSGLILGGQSFEQQTDCILSVCGSNWQISQESGCNRVSVPRRAQKHGRDIKTAMFWVDINLAVLKELTFYQTSIECNHPSRRTSSLLYSESC